MSNNSFNSNIDLSSIPVLAELERNGVSFDYESENEVKTKCPFHDDNSPSCMVNVEKRVFKCHASSCGQTGDFVAFLAGALKTDRKTILADLQTRYDLQTDKTISAELIEVYHQTIWQAKTLLAELYKRGVTDELIRKYRLGCSDGRITIPIYNTHGACVNVRKYLPGAAGRQKMRNTRGYSQPRLYPIEQLTKYNQVVLTGGEIKAIVAANELNRHSIGAITTTLGEGNWSPEFNKLFVGKTVYVLFDIDEGGQRGAAQICNILAKFAGYVANIRLDTVLDIDKYPHGDINDFVGIEKGDLFELINSQNQNEWQPTSFVSGSRDLSKDAPKELSLIEAVNAQNSGKRISVKAVVSAVSDSPYSIPKKLLPICDQSQKECAFCPLFLEGDFSNPITIHPEHDCILEMIGHKRSVQREAIMRGVGIPKTCKSVEFDIKEYYNVEDVRVSPQLEITSRSSDRIMQPAYCIGNGLELNETYNLIGRNWPNPATQQTTLLISEYATATDALSSFALTTEHKTSLQKFKCSPDSLLNKLTEIYNDLENNVTNIYQRKDLHLVIDLVYHSPLLINFEGKTVKGWVENLVVGDSAQGKSETANSLQKHYGLGEKVECKNASVPGLLGGLQQMGTKWFVSWGMIPTHDKRLVILEELKGASIEVISKLTDMRSTGVAEIPKIEKRRTHARTRLLAISNPRTNRKISSYAFGIECAKELIGGLEDLRRFDMVYLASANDVDPKIINQMRDSNNGNSVQHVYDSDSCRALILWVWTRKPEQVIFSKETIARVLQHATALSEKFVDDIPIVDRGSMRHKLAKLSAAIAGRVFSSDATGENLLVLPEHVDFIFSFLDRLYSSPTFGYLDYTEARRLTEYLVDPEIVERAINATPFPKDLIQSLIRANMIESQDLQDWCTLDKIEVQKLISVLVRKQALMRIGKAYVKTPPFIVLLRDMLENNRFTERPDYIEEQF